MQYALHRMLLHLIKMSNNDFILLLNKLIATTTEKWINFLLCGLQRTILQTFCMENRKKLYLDLNKLSTCDILT